MDPHSFPTSDPPPPEPRWSPERVPCEGHGHTHRQASRRGLLGALILTALCLLLELGGGVLTNSLALLADAGHMFTDVAALGLSLGAMHLASQPPTPMRSFGYYRLEILAALLNGALLIVVAGGILFEMIHRLAAPPLVAAPPMMAIASVGLVVNLLSAWFLARADHDNLNVRGALLHVLSDAVGSAGAVLAGALMWRFGWYWADPAISGLVGVLVLRSAWQLVTSSVDILLQNTPLHIDPAEVVHAIEGVPGVVESHDLHVWTVTSGMVSLTCHVVVDDLQAGMSVLEKVRTALHDRFGIEHATVQLEGASFTACHRLRW